VEVAVKKVMDIMDMDIVVVSVVLFVIVSVIEDISIFAVGLVRLREFK
jgi:hypothetical protein